jgi:hypothetical protein
MAGLLRRSFEIDLPRTRPPFEEATLKTTTTTRSAMVHTVLDSWQLHGWISDAIGAASLGIMI